MINRIRTLLTTLVLITSLFACNMPEAEQVPPPGDVQTSAALTVEALLIPPSVTATARQGEQPILPDTPASTPTLTAGPTGTITPTYSVPMLKVLEQTNCRTGPGVVYDKIAVLVPGTPAEVIGRNAAGDTWVIKLPSNPSVTCWLWGEYATVVGNTSGLTIYTPPPTPTPAANFTVAYLGPFNCMGSFGFRFQITNNGSLTWESYQVVVTDANTSITTTYAKDDFTDVGTFCVITNTLVDLTPGEVGVSGNWGVGLFSYNPAGHNMSATFKLCTENGIAGTCLEKSITFVP